MKKVVSALTATAMCASMAAGVVSVFAYTTDEVGYYLAATSTGDKYTVSEDGKTITFASAADAAGAKFTVGQYIVADTANPAVQQIGGMVEGSSPLVHLVAGSSAQMETPVGAAKEYTAAGGVTFTTDLRPNAFGFVDFLGDYMNSCSNLSWGHSSTWPESWGYTSDNERLTWVWVYAFDQSDYDNYKETAHFLGEKSDDFALVEFEVELDSAITDGTYTVDWVEKSPNEFGDAQATFLNSGDSVLMPIGSLEGLTIVVGDGETQPTETDPQPTETDPQPTDDDEPGLNTDKFTWDIADEVKPETAANGSRVAYIDVYVYNCQGTNGFNAGMLINGKTFAEMNAENGMKLAKINKGDAYPNLSYTPNLDDGIVGAANNSDDQGTQTAENGATVMTFVVQIPDTVPDGVYDLTLYEMRVGSGDGDAILDPVLGTGSLIIGDVEPTETDPQPTETDPQPTDGDYLYGDVNKNGVVELVDIVMLNRYLTGYGDQQLDDYQTEVADCYDNAKLEGTDSVQILKYLIGLSDTARVDA